MTSRLVVSSVTEAMTSRLVVRSVTDYDKQASSQVGDRDQVRKSG